MRYAHNPMSEEVTISEEEGLLKIRFLVSRLDAAAAGRLKKSLHGVPGEGIRRVEIDLEPVAFIDSSGVGVLLGIYRQLPEDSAEVRLAHVGPTVRSVLELLRLHRIFAIE